jgi:hypothetical protein
MLRDAVKAIFFFNRWQTALFSLRTHSRPISDLEASPNPHWVGNRPARSGARKNENGHRVYSQSARARRWRRANKRGEFAE